MSNDAPLVVHHAEGEDHWSVQGLGRLLLGMGMKVDFFHRLRTRTTLQGPSSDLENASVGQCSVRGPRH